MGTFYRSRHELIFAFKNGTAPHINSFELGQHGRYRTNVWQYKGVNTLKAGRMDELALHPTVKPVQMIADAIKDVSRRGAIVLDLFGGSGSTLIAAHKTGRRAFSAKLDPIYCDRIIRRWEALPRTRRNRSPAASTPGMASSRGRPQNESTKADDAGASARRLRDTTYEVGYRKPPLEHRFQKGRSGNPKGRPKGSKSVRALLEAVLAAPVTITEGGVAKVIEQRMALFRSLVARAIKGDPRAAALVVKLMDDVGMSKPEAPAAVTTITRVIVQPK